MNILAEIDLRLVAMSGVTLLLVGLTFVVILNTAYAKLKVEQDPTVEAILNVLPGANCGGCGLAGCGAYAEAVAADHGLMGKCGPGGEELVKQIALILGIEASASAPIRAVVHCSARTEDRINTTDYYGVPHCSEANMVAGSMGCPYGCFGLGDCAEACEFDAIHVVDGLATVDYNKCVGCGACVAACPRNIIELVPFAEDPLFVIGCSTRDKAKDVRTYCKVGCVGCSLCAKMAPDMITMVNALPVIDYEKYGDEETRDKAQDKCPRALMVYVGKKNRGVPELQPTEPLAE